MPVRCYRKLNGRFVVESEAGDNFEFQVVTVRDVVQVRRIGPPHWRPGPWPDDAKAIASAAHAAARQRARCDGFPV